MAPGKSDFGGSANDPGRRFLWSEGQRFSLEAGGVLGREQLQARAISAVPVIQQKRLSLSWGRAGALTRHPRAHSFTNRWRFPLTGGTATGRSLSKTGEAVMAEEV